MQTFCDLDRDGLIAWQVSPTKPPSVEYRLTPFGQMMLTPLTILVQWPDRSQEAVRNVRLAHDRMP